jgi:hypothetical protein
MIKNRKNILIHGKIKETLLFVQIYTIKMKVLSWKELSPLVSLPKENLLYKDVTIKLKKKKILQKIAIKKIKLMNSFKI